MAAMCACIGQQEEKIRVGDPGLVAEARFAEGWLEGDQSFILRTDPGALSSRPGRHTYGQRKFAVLPIVSGKTTIKAGSLPPFSLSVIVPCLAGALSCPGRGRRKRLPPHGLPAPWSNAPDRCERLSRPCTGKPPSTFSLSCPGPLGQTGRSPGSYSVAPPRFGPRQAGRWRCPGQQEDTRCRLEFMISCLSPAHDNLYEQTL